MIGPSPLCISAFQRLTWVLPSVAPCWVKGSLSDAAGGAQFSRHITNYHEEVAVMRSFLG
jgi:hypothetical protein